MSNLSPASNPLQTPRITRVDGSWRKARLAARLLLQSESRSLSPVRAKVALQLADDTEVTNRLIQHGLDWFRGREAQRARLAQ